MQPEGPIIVNGVPVVNNREYVDWTKRGSDRRRLVAIVAGAAGAVLLIGGGIWFYIAHSNSALSLIPANVQITNTGFSPSTMKIKKGQGITWTDKEPAAHHIYADQTSVAGLDSVDVLQTGDSYTYVFEKAGTYRYYDPANPSQFVGTVIVE